jgi:hypothetical protein
MKVLSVIWSGRILMMWRHGLLVLVELVRHILEDCIYVSNR